MPKTNRSVTIDNTQSGSPKRYQIGVLLAGGALGLNILGLRKLNANAVVRIYKVMVTVTHVAAGLGPPLRVSRATDVAAGTLVTASDVPKKDTNDPDATLEVRTGAITGTVAGQILLWIGGCTVTGTGLGGPLDTWEAMDREDMITLRGDEGLIFEVGSTGDTDDRYAITIAWEEE